MKHISAFCIALGMIVASTSYASAATLSYDPSSDQGQSPDPQYDFTVPRAAAGPIGYQDPNPPSTPLPAALPLFGFAVAGLVAARRKKN